MTDMVSRAEPGTTSDMLSDRCRDTGSRMVLRRCEARGHIEGAQDKQRNKDGELKSHDLKDSAWHDGKISMWCQGR